MGNTGFSEYALNIDADLMCWRTVCLFTEQVINQARDYN